MTEHASTRGQPHKVRSQSRDAAKETNEVLYPKPLGDDVQSNVNRGGKKWEKYKASICKIIWNNEVGFSHIVDKGWNGDSSLN